MIQSDHMKAPSTLAGVLRAVKAMLSLSADKTPVKIGEQYLTANQGIGPSILFLPDTGGRIAEAIQSGHACASWVHGCEVRVRAKPGIDEEDVFANCYALADKVIGALAIAASGRIEWGAARGESPDPSNKLGAEVVFAFSYRRDIPHAPRMWAIDYPALNTNDPLSTVRELAQYTPADQPTIPETLEGEPVVTPTVTPEEG